MGEYTNKTEIQRFLYADTLLLLFLCVFFEDFILIWQSFYTFCQVFTSTSIETYANIEIIRGFLVTKVARCISEQTLSNGRMTIIMTIIMSLQFLRPLLPLLAKGRSAITKCTTQNNVSDSDISGRHFLFDNRWRNGTYITNDIRGISPSFH